MGPTTPGPTDHVALRRLIVGRLRADLLGPRASDESLRQRPEDEYLLGALAPGSTELTAEDTEEELAGAPEDGETDISSAYGGMKQSAIGLTAVLPVDASAPLTVTASYGTYTRVVSPLVPSRWERTAHVQNITWEPGKMGRGSHSLSEGATLEWRARRRGDAVFVTFSLVNRNTKDSKRMLFQPAIMARPTDSTATPFIEGARPYHDLDDTDQESDRLLYRDVREYAVGHGCAAVWRSDDDGHVREVWTELLPEYEVPAVEPLQHSGAVLDMDALADLGDDGALAAAVGPLINEYGAWIEGEQRRCASLEPSLRPIADQHMAACEEAAERMRSGARLIASDPRVAEAFRQANAAMAWQRRASYAAAQFRETGRRVDPTSPPTWRPFQLAFFLLNIRSLACPGVAEADLVDLLWFPTGGGKTEAYLGLAAFTLFARRLGVTPPGMIGAEGTAVLMRYTLRLLTAQQFERAAALICACEMLRREDPTTWGNQPFAIGLWVGQAATPNRYKDAVEALAEIDRRERDLSDHPFVLRACPWCGESLGRASFVADDHAERIKIICRRAGCEFSTDDGLPVIVVDDEVYRRPPSILIGTVDKFARLPWVPEAAAIFGHARYRCERHGLTPDPSSHACVTREIPPIAPPALVIQDELHLISGPLGSLVGLYETAIEYLSTREVDGATYRPKVIASTATIRHAHDQVRGLFARDLRLFPPPAIDPFNSFFAQRVPISERPGRLFVGLCAFGRSSKTMQVRLYASLLTAVYPYRDIPDLIDPYWTIVAYFNTIPQLGGAVSLVQDDIQTRLKALAAGGDGRVIQRQEELTSRVPSTQIPERLRAMQERVAGGKALDILLASNMISVGLDVGRLGLMAINGQPKTTSEYIQAASRIGREHPGLVITGYSWTAPRDLSHYERFLVYHQTLYRHVEATSVTPFAPRARDRALHAVMIAALRLSHPRLIASDAAERFRRAEFDTTALVDFMVRRVELSEVASSSPSDEVIAVAAELERLLDTWEEAAANPGFPLIYGQYRAPKPPRVPMMIPAGPGAVAATHAVTRPTLNSLRDVEAQAEWRRA